MSEVISHPLWIIFDKSIKVRAIPEDWKKAKISAIYKKGNKALAGNYRPISLTSVVCKLMETLIRDIASLNTWIETVCLQPNSMALCRDALQHYSL
jgi:hypothetical protein